MAASESKWSVPVKDGHGLGSPVRNIFVKDFVLIHIEIELEHGSHCKIQGTP